jgi:alanine-glyoxylate transaminase/serine-glyoxylate transaminase/serine-pyruvate transaminase
LGGIEVKVDEWELDAVYSGTQKCLSCPPGLAPVTFGPRAVAALEKRKAKVASWYLDLTMVRSYWGRDRAYHHTAPINMNIGLHEALRIVLEEGLPARFERHQRDHRALKAGLNALGVNYAVTEPHQLPMLNAVLIPSGADDGAVRKQLLIEFGIEIGGGLGPLKGKTWRIGLMGETSTQSNVLLFLAALERCLSTAGQRISGGAGVAAANASYGSSIAQK